jgi:uncharacterized membrane protein
MFNMSLQTGIGFVLVTTFLASTVEAIEMVTIVVGVGATRGWRATLIGAGSGFAVLAVVVAVFGLALSAIPIGPLLLVFGLQWFRKGVTRVAAHGLAGMKAGHADEEAWTGPGFDWTAFVLAFKGVVLEGLEVAFIVVTFGVTANQLGPAVIGGVSAVVIVSAIGAAVQPLVARIPRSLLQLVVGTMLTTFGTFWCCSPSTCRQRWRSSRSSAATHSDSRPGGKHEIDLVVRRCVRPLLVPIHRRR